jgi:hypothetical protein
MLGGAAGAPRRGAARCAGNRAATHAVGRLLQRDPVKPPPPKQPTTAERLKDLETRQTALEKRTAVLELDAVRGA